MFEKIINEWKEQLQNKKFRTEFILTIPVLIVTMIRLSGFLEFIEIRGGAMLHDPVLRHFSPIDLSTPIFIILYPCVILAFIFLLQNPRQLLITFQSYIVLIIFRIIALFLLPLDPPLTIIPLADPIVQFFVNGNVLTRDLFFSGHTSLMFLLFLTVQKKWLRIIFIIGTVLTATFVILQHVHYTVDVFIAPFMSFTSYMIISNVRNRDKT